MEISQSYLLTLTLALGYEYGLKQWWSGITATKDNHPIYRYVLYRLIHLLLLAVSGLLLFRDLHVVSWLSLSVCFVLLGSLELPLHAISRRILSRAGVSSYLLNYLIPLSLILSGRLGKYAKYVPRLDLDYRLLFLFILLAHPANHFIRWALDKDDPVLSNQTTSDAPTYASEAEAAATTLETERNLDLVDQRAKVGRRIGTLERWLIVLLIASDSISSLGLVITAKSIVRFPQLSDKDFAEYYLFGTLLSVVLALVAGFFILGGL